MPPVTTQPTATEQMALGCSAPTVHRPLPVGRSHSWRPMVRADAADLVSLPIRQKGAAWPLSSFLFINISRLPPAPSRRHAPQHHAPSTTRPDDNSPIPICLRPSPLPTEGLLERARLLLPIDWVNTDNDNDNDTTVEPRDGWQQEKGTAMRSAWPCTSCAARLLSAVFGRGAQASSHVRPKGGLVHRVAKAQITAPPSLLPRDGAVCPTDHSLCPDTLGGGCCPSRYACAADSCYATTAAIASACGQEGWFACPAADSGEYQRNVCY